MDNNKLFIQLKKVKKIGKAKFALSIIGIILSVLVALAIVGVAIYGLVLAPIGLASKGL
ncbi:hypothetical protein AB5V95_02040 [Metamycoplasma spumans]|uniref:hypothetical protein n=1 Tax=Metamycoplasma spumans TaxID=92406 RepID=UPI000A4930B6